MQTETICMTFMQFVENFFDSLTETIKIKYKIFSLENISHHCMILTLQIYFNDNILTVNVSTAIHIDQNPYSTKLKSILKSLYAF